jgi:hypothetical protein
LRVSGWSSAIVATPRSETSYRRVAKVGIAAEA